MQWPGPWLCEERVCNKELSLWIAKRSHQPWSPCRWPVQKPGIHLMGSMLHTIHCQNVPIGRSVSEWRALSQWVCSQGDKWYALHLGGPQDLQEHCLQNGTANKICCKEYLFCISIPSKPIVFTNSNGETVLISSSVSIFKTFACYYSNQSSHDVISQKIADSAIILKGCQAGAQGRIDRF